MIERNEILRSLHEKHIVNTAPETMVTLVKVHFCHLTNHVCKGVLIAGIDLPLKVYINTKVLKHLYDKRPAQEYDFILINLELLITFPEYVYKNKNPKRGDICFVKEIDDIKYFCSLEIAGEESHIVTAFRLKPNKESYLNSYELLWSWKDGEPSS